MSFKQFLTEKKMPKEFLNRPRDEDGLIRITNKEICKFYKIFEKQFKKMFSGGEVEYLILDAYNDEIWDLLGLKIRKKKDFVEFDAGKDACDDREIFLYCGIVEKGSDRSTEIHYNGILSLIANESALKNNNGYWAVDPETFQIDFYDYAEYHTVQFSGAVTIFKDGKEVYSNDLIDSYTPWDAKEAVKIINQMSNK